MNKLLVPLLLTAFSLSPCVAAGSTQHAILVQNETQHGVVVHAYDRNRTPVLLECIPASGTSHLPLSNEHVWLLHFQVFERAACDGHVVWNADSIAPRGRNFQLHYVLSGSRARFALQGP